MSEWKKIKLGDLISIKGGFSYKGKFIGKGSSILLGMGCVSFNEKFLHSGGRLYSGEFPESHLAKPGDLVLATRQQSDNMPILGFPAIIPKDYEDKTVIVGTNLYKVTNDSEIDNYFLYWLFKSPNYRSHILASSKGTTVRMITKDAVETFEFYCPEKEEREAISETLWQIERKIDLLNHQNKTLEELAQTLFRQWFIEEAKDEWEEKSLFDVINLVGGGTPKTSIDYYWNGNISWLSGGDITSSHRSFIINSEKSITELGLQKSSTKLLPKYASVISARGTVGKFCILSKPMTFSQSNYGVLPKLDDTFFFTYLLLSHSVEELQSAAYGSVFDTITTKTFKEHKVVVPANHEIVKFEKYIRDYFLKIEHNTNQIATLENIRDTLLPKLISGEVRVDYEL